MRTLAHAINTDPISTDTTSMLYAALDNLINATKIIKREYKSQQDIMGREVWLRDFCTIKLQAARRSGHDSCIRKMIETNADKQFMIVHPTIDQSRYFKENSRSCSNYSLAVAYNLGNYRDISDIDYLVVNTASCVRQEDLKNIYSFALSCFANNPDFLIILIG